MKRRAPYTQPVELSFENGPCCSSCRDGFVSGDNLVVCPGCRALSHRECLGKAGACMTFGCSFGVPVPRLPRSRRMRALAILGSALLLAGGAALLWIPKPVEPVVGCELPVWEAEIEPVWSAPVPFVPVAPVRVYSQPVEALRPQVRLRVSSTVRSSEVLIQGQIEGDGPLRVEVNAPSGRVGWDAFEPGNFVTGVTLLTTGRHEITVTVTDRRGRVSTTSYVVDRVS